MQLKQNLLLLIINFLSQQQQQQQQHTEKSIYLAECTAVSKLGLSILDMKFTAKVTSPACWFIESG